MYPSDYGYATSGGSVMDRDTCLNTELFSWQNSNSCFINDWLYNGSYFGWTLTPHSIFSSRVFITSDTGYVSFNDVYYSNDVFPVLYLSSNVKITGGDGSEGNPYTLSIE